MRIFKDTRGKSWFNVFEDIKGQIDVTISYPGTVRAFHYHDLQVEYWFVVKGEYKFVLKKPNREKEIKYLAIIRSQ